MFLFIVHEQNNDFLKGIVHPKMKILSSFTHLYVIPNIFFCETEKEWFCKMCLHGFYFWVSNFFICSLHIHSKIDTLHIVRYHVKITSLSVSAVVFSPLVFYWFSLFCCFHLFVLDSAQLYCPVYLCFQAIVNHVVIFVFVLALYHNLSFLVVFMCRKKDCHFLV